MEAPKEIYLQVDPDGEGDFRHNDDITWCQDQINDSDVKYVRADMAICAVCLEMLDP